MLNIYKAILKTYNANIEMFLTAVGYDSQFVTVRWVDSLLVEEGSTINNRNVFTALYSRYYVRLER